MVTDAITGKPIAGATVFVFWGHPMPGGWETAPWWKCDGAASATSDAQGHFDMRVPLGVGFRPNLDDRAAKMLVVAQGYYDDRVLNGGAMDSGSATRPHPLQWRAHKPDEYLWTPTLMPFGNADIDAKLQALEAMTYEGPPSGTQIPDACVDTEAFQRYRLAVAQAFDQALCPDAGTTQQTPRTDLFRAHRFGRRDLPKADQDRYVFLYRELIEPLVSKQPDAPLSPLALANTCAWVREQRNPSEGPASMRLQVPVIATTGGATISNIPIRFLWGWRHNAPSSRTLMDAARRGFVLRTDEHGRVGLPITRAMVDEQGLDFADYREQLHYAAVPLTRDRVSLSSGRNFIGPVADGSILHDEYLRHMSDLGQSPELERLTTMQFEQIASAGSADGELVGNGFWRYPTEVKLLQKVAGEEQARKAEAAGKAEPFAVHTYAWQWPGIALLWRSYTLLKTPVDVEDDERAWTSLLRHEIAGTFDQLCSEPDQPMSPTETGDALQLLWWIETQLVGRELADVRARERAVAWDHGVHCEYNGARLLSQGRSRDAFRSHALCETWKSLPRDVDAVIATKPDPGELRIDYSHRAHACPNMPNNGAFQ